MKYTIVLTFLLLPFLSFSQSYLGYANDATDLIDTNYQVIKHIPKGDALFLISLDTQQGHYNVIHIKTNKEGFIPRKLVTLERVVPQVEGNIFSAVHTSEVKAPIIKIFNNSKTTMTVKLNEEVIEVTPKEKKTVNLNQGRYYYRVSAPNIEPYYGVEVLDDFRLYEWEFYIGDM